MRVYASLALASAFLLSGCALNTTATNTVSHASESSAFGGTIHGGQQPVSGSHIYLFAAGTTASAGKGITASTANASVSLITDTTLNDGRGNYVLSDANGNFSLGGKYTCTAGQNVYALAYGGDPGLGSSNFYIEMMAVLGTCPASGNFASQIGFFTINEETTVAAAFALGSFATDPLHISDDEAAAGNTTAAVAATGLKNAFANSFSLVQQASGMPYNYDNLGPNGAFQYGIAINSIANMLAYCINSNGSTCSNLFFKTPSSTGVIPSDTATAAINIAQNPGANVAGLIGLTSATSPFQPSFNVGDTNDLQLAVRFYITGVQHQRLAVDASGNVYVSSYQHGFSGNGIIAKIGPQGAVLGGQYGMGGSNVVYSPGGIAIDPNNGNVWATAGNVVAFTAPGTFLSPALGWAPSTDGTGNNGTHIAFDSNGNVWTGANNFTAKFSNTGTLLSGASGFISNYYVNTLRADALGNMWTGIYTAGGYVGVQKITPAGSATLYTSSQGNALFGICVDANNSPWGSDYGGGLTHFSAAGVASNRIVASYDAGWGCAVDGNNSIWHASRDGAIHQFKNDGTRITPPIVDGSNKGGIRGYYLMSNPLDIAIDASGSTWILNDDDNTVTQIFGAAAPVVVPMGLAAKLNKIGQRP